MATSTSMVESDASRSGSDSVSALLDGAEASGLGNAAGLSSSSENEAYGEISLASKANQSNDSHCPS